MVHTWLDSVLLSGRWQAVVVVVWREEGEGLRVNWKAGRRGSGIEM
ncbi:hypothetical protein KC19_VG264900 [Ceratodon purpureus]|uniref:Uncharacterized protein n=1 Tax=Ceratodon purpureus TaxID=3225 RepID=A0A8T0HUR8_CERPU|nr:hypothetical protein KC19_VG264900 [Ceratodon purpureus]